MIKEIADLVKFMAVLGKNLYSKVKRSSKITVSHAKIDEGMEMKDKARKYNLEFKSHKVTTKDGFILELEEVF